MIWKGDGCFTGAGGDGEQDAVPASGDRLEHSAHSDVSMEAGLPAIALISAVGDGGEVIASHPSQRMPATHPSGMHTMISEQMLTPVLRLRLGELLRLAAHGDPRSGITTGCPAVAKRAVWRQR